MEKWRGISLKLAALVTLTSVFGFGTGATAATSTPKEVKELQAEIQNKKAAIESIGNKLDEYKKKISEYSKQTSSLMKDVTLLENEMMMSELDVAATQNEIDASRLELELLTHQIDEADARLAKEKSMLGDLVFALHEQDMNGGAFELLLGAKTFEEVFRAAADLESVNGDLKKTLATTQRTREGLQEDMVKQDGKLSELEKLELSLLSQIEVLENRRSAKEVLAMETSQSEAEYRVLTQELRQEQQSISSRINQLQNEVENRIESDPTSVGDTAALIWPARGRITTTFYDPTYPFRYLFEHGGLDIAIPDDNTATM